MEREYRYFQQRVNAAGKLGFTALQKCTAAIGQLAYDVASDLLDEYLQMAERTSREALGHFCSGVIRLYERTYLRRSTWTDLQHIYMMCMKEFMEMCLTAWRGTHTRSDIGRPSMILQAVASYDLWIWNAFFRPQGSHNDINVFKSSHVLEDLISGLTPSASFYANGNFYERGYYLGDGIYPEYATFVKTFTDPVNEKIKLFKKK
uniref:uncharacterized protein LOC122601544 n=1 Tax=Erigeron canadensis TaxID=72917 RepID=UPI001CB95647|nr:uncharacterized protein LOC122601544 [Erigeron canadensis]